jgi:hypothetical protein
MIEAGLSKNAPDARLVILKDLGIVGEPSQARSLPSTWSARMSLTARLTGVGTPAACRVRG